MTTIAWDGTTLAADSLYALGNHKWFVPDSKLIWVPYEGEYAMFGDVGGVEASVLVIQWLHEGADPDVKPLFLAESEYSALLVTRHGALAMSSNLVPYAVPPPFAIGGGWEFARAALHMGASAEGAVQVAIDLCVLTGGPIQTLRWEDAPRLGRKKKCSR